MRRGAPLLRLDRIIERASVTFRTLHPPRRVAVDGVRPPFTLDGLVTVSVARVAFGRGDARR